MLKKILLLVVVVAASNVVPPPAQAQTTEAPGELDSLAIDSDQRTDRVGLVDPATGIWNLRNAGGAVTSFFYGDPGDYPFVGDWNCDGIDTPGLYRQSDGFVYLRDSNSQGVANIRFFFGNPGDIPLAGDFNNDGCDTVSIYRPSESRIYVINELGSNDGGLGAADFNYIFGNPGDKPFVGDFNGDGTDTVGLHRESTGFVYFRQTHTQGIADAEFFFGDPGDRLVAGDWGVLDGVDTPALFRPSNTTFFFRHTNTQGVADQSVVWGSSSFLPVAGRWKLSDTPPAPTISGPVTPALVSSAYSATLTKTGGVAPLVVEKTSGPSWLKVNAAGVVTGTAPATVGTANLGVRITDRRGLSSTATIPIRVVNGCEGTGTLPLNQCQALVQLFKATKGYGWLDQTGWLAGNPCTSWHGITCGVNTVSAIEMDENNLAGTLPSLSAFPALITLDLGGNAIGGAIPNISTLTSLQTLNLGANKLSGSIPAAVWTRSSLRNVDLGANRLGGGLPPTITLPALLTLDISQNNLTGGFPAPFWTLTTLTTLDVSENQFVGQIPAAVGNYNVLQELDLSDNQMNGPVPNQIFNLQDTLTNLGMHGNQCFTSGNATVRAFLTGLDADWNDGCA